MAKSEKIYGQVRFVGKVVKVDDKPRTCEFGIYENMTVVPVIMGQSVDDLDREIIGACEGIEDGE